MVTDDDLNYYYYLVETTWLGGTNPTLEEIRLRIRPTERDSSPLIEGLATLVARNWLKIQQIPVSAWDPETIYETWYVPIRDHDPDSQ
ncbi:MAG: hypothetical protein ABIQ73_29980 [Acidimicrobiales bacterium]